MRVKDALDLHLRTQDAHPTDLSAADRRARSRGRHPRHAGPGRAAPGRAGTAPGPGRDRRRHAQGRRGRTARHRRRAALRRGIAGREHPDPGRRRGRGTAAGRQQRHRAAAGRGAPDPRGADEGGFGQPAPGQAGHRRLRRVALGPCQGRADPAPDRGDRRRHAHARAGGAGVAARRAGALRRGGTDPPAPRADHRPDGPPGRHPGVDRVLPRSRARPARRAASASSTSPARSLEALGYWPIPDAPLPASASELGELAGASLEQARPESADTGAAAPAFTVETSSPAATATDGRRHRVARPRIGRGQP